MRPLSILLFVIVGLTILSMAVAWGNLPASSQKQALAAGAKTPVIVELFTSEGCSSCPPADAVLAELEKRQPVANAQIIALGEHVDYWNQLGWADPFSSGKFSERQQDYSRALNANVYTPQMIVNGQVEFIGSNLKQATDAIAKAVRAPQAKVQITRLAPDQISVTATDIPKVAAGDTLDILLAITETNLSTNVARGENAGRKLNHVTVVRQLTVIGTAPSATAKLSFEPNWQRANLRIVAFLQERMSRRIVGIAAINGSEIQP